MRSRRRFLFERIARSRRRMYRARSKFWRMKLVLALATLFAVALSGALGANVDYGRDVLPILSDKCYHCHGPDEKARKAKLRLDTKEGAFRVKDGKAVIAPGKSAESELVRRITTTDPEEVM